MKTRVIVLILGLVFISASFFIGTSYAESMVSGSFTGDDIVWVYGYDGNGNWGGTGWWKKPSDDWRSAGLAFGFPKTGEPIDIYFAVKNIQDIVPETDHQYEPGEFNPAGFLASIETSNSFFAETGTNKLLTGAAHWDIVAHDGWAEAPSFDPSALTGWVAPTLYGANNSPTLWNQVFGYNPVPGIDGDAQWIWTANNFTQDMDNYAVIHTRVTVTPEPASMMLFGLGGVAYAFMRSRRK